MKQSYGCSITSSGPLRGVLSTLVGTVLMTAAAVAAPTYRIVELPLLPDTRHSSAYAVNTAGHIVGTAESTSLNGYGISWGAPPYAPHALVGLDPTNPGWWTTATAVNDAGFVVGTGSLGGIDHVAVMWDPSGAIVQLGDLPRGSVKSEANDINASGVAVGFGTRGGLESNRPVFWTAPGAIHPLLDLPGGPFGGEALALNDAGEIVGFGSITLTRYHAVRWPAGQRRGQDLGDLPGGDDISFAYDINNVGQVVGYGFSELGKRAVLWNSDGSMTDLGDVSGGSGYEAVGIDPVGRVVGRFTRGLLRQAFLWTAAEGMKDLLDLIDPADPLRAQFAADDVYVFAINPAGLIVGNMTLPGSMSRAIVLVPQD